MNKKQITLFLAILFTTHLFAQTNTDTLKVLAYNVNDYGSNGGSSCPTQRTYLKSAYLRTILKYADADIIGLDKIKTKTAVFATDSIVDKVLDSVCNGCWGHTTYTHASGYNKVDMVYYRTDKIGFINTTVMFSGDPNTTDIDLQKFYYKSPTLATTHDTVFLNIILIHDASGSSSSGERDTDIVAVMNWLSTHVSKPGNYIFMGDFNLQYAYEPCYQAMINPTDTTVKFYDAVSTASAGGGDWSGKPNLFAQYLTQCTRLVDPGDCASVNGLNQWYDHILCSNPIMRGIDSVRYVDNSFTVIGQDGLHVNAALIDAPTNTSVPANVLTALYQMSEHLPVMAKFAIGRSVNAVSTISWQPLQVTYNTLVSNELVIHADAKAKHMPTYQLSVYDMMGSRVYNTQYIYQPVNSFDVKQLPQGMYMLQLMQDNAPVFNGKFVKL